MSLPVFMKMLRLLGMVKANGQPNFFEIVFKELEICLKNGTVKNVIFGLSMVLC